LSGATINAKKHEVPEALLASLLADYKKPEDPIGESGLLKRLTKLLVVKALDAELTEGAKTAKRRNKHDNR
jgi:putative transposase